MMNNKKMENDYLNLLDDYGLLEEYTKSRGDFIEALTRRIYKSESEREKEHFLNLKMFAEKLKTESPEKYDEIYNRDKEIGFYQSWVMTFMSDYNLNLSILDQIFIGEFPTNSFNAEARKTNNGTLVLINKGLRLFLFNIAGSIIESLIYYNFSEEAYKKALGRVIYTCINYINERKHSIPLSEDKKQTSEIMRSVAYLSMSMRNFIFAHEIGHAVLGHLSKGKKTALETSIGKFEVEKRSYNMEFEADSYAQNLIINSNKESGYYNFAISGGIGFFMSHRILNLIKFKLGIKKQIEKKSQTHPQSSVRLKKIMSIIEENIDEQGNRMAKGFHVMFLNIYDMINEGEFKSENGKIIFVFKE